MVSYDGVVINIQIGDVLTSKKGFLQKSHISEKFYVFHKQEYLGGGRWIIKDEKKEVNAKKRWNNEIKK